MNHGICFFRSLQCGIFYVVSFFSVLLLLAHLSLFGTPKTNGNFKIFRVKTTTNGQMICIHGNASLSLSFSSVSLLLKLDFCLGVKWALLAIYHLHHNTHSLSRNRAYIHKYYYYIFTHFEYMFA